MRTVHHGTSLYIDTEFGKARLDYKMENGDMAIYHTFVPPQIRDRGLAEKLAFAAFDYAAQERIKIRPQCPYIIHFLEKHTELKKYVRE